MGIIGIVYVLITYSSKKLLNFLKKHRNAIKAYVLIAALVIAIASGYWWAYLLGVTVYGIWHLRTIYQAYFSWWKLAFNNLWNKKDMEKDQVINHNDLIDLDLLGLLNSGVSSKSKTNSKSDEVCKKKKKNS